MEAGHQPLLLETGFFENAVIRNKGGFRTGLLGFSHHRQEAVNQLRLGNPSFVLIFINFSILINPDPHIVGQGIYHGGTYAV